MHDEQAFLHALQKHPEDASLRLVFADWLEEKGDPRGELVRLLHTLTQAIDVADRSVLENRLRGLLAAGVRPVGPFWTNTLGMKLACIPPGSFLMGSPEAEEERCGGETQHKVTLTKGFYLAIHPVTQACWRGIMGNNPSHHQGDDLPVEQVSWDDCHEFFRRMSDREGHIYRLPTEAEWEYGCRAGTTTPFCFGETISTDQANYDGNSIYGHGKKGEYRDRTTPEGSFPANAWGVHDMHGNLWEWCADWYEYEYAQDDVVDPQGPAQGTHRAIRGGMFDDLPSYARSASRASNDPSGRYKHVGFRAAVTYT